MYFLISNDDGIMARGIQVLSKRMQQLGKVTVIAPDQNYSGASNSLTLDSPIRIKQIDEQSYRVSGTPTDCVHIALTGLLDRDPDMVVSGINTGANLGDDVIYSGTVAAAMEGPVSRAACDCRIAGNPGTAGAFRNCRGSRRASSLTACAAILCRPIRS